MANETFLSGHISTPTTNQTPVMGLTCWSRNASVDYLYTCIVPSPGEWILIGAYIVTFLVGVLGNILVCFAVWRNNEMRTETNIYMVNLSLADLTVLIVLLPSALLVDVTGTWFLGFAMCKISIALGTMCISVSVLTLTAISLERWYAICHPLRFHSTVRRARLVIIIIWIISGFVALPEFLSSTVVPKRTDTVIYSRCYPALWKTSDVVIFQICLMVGLYFLPLMLMGFTHTHIAVVLWRGSISNALEMSTESQLRRQYIRDSYDHTEGRKKAARMLIAIVVLFALCFLPNHTLNILRYMGKLRTLPHVQIFALIAHWAAFFNSCINPIVYNFMSDKFRKEFRVAVLLCLRCGHRGRRYNATRGKYQVSLTDKRKLTFRSSNASNCVLQNTTTLETV